MYVRVIDGERGIVLTEEEFDEVQNALLHFLDGMDMRSKSDNPPCVWKANTILMDALAMLVDQDGQE